jgi:predicted transcriptional regulator
MAKRTKINIVYDILKAICDRNNKMLQTHILYSSNLSYHVLEEYLRNLLMNNLIIETHDRTKRFYGLTDKGFEFLDRYSDVVEFKQSFGLE